MSADFDAVLPTAKEVLTQAALQAADKQEEHERRIAALEAQKRELIERLSKPSGMTEEEKVKLAASVIQRAVRNGLKEVQVYRFPNAMCTDHGRAINQQEPGWEKTLTGIPKEIYKLWKDHLEPKGYRMQYMIIDFPGGMPGDVGVVLSWG